MENTANRQGDLLDARGTQSWTILIICGVVEIHKCADTRAVSAIWVRRNVRTSGSRTVHLKCVVATQYSRNWRTKARESPTYSTFPLHESYNPCDLRPFLYFSPKILAVIVWRMHELSVWNMACYIWNGRVETDALTHDPHYLESQCWLLAIEKPIRPLGLIPHVKE